MVVAGLALQAVGFAWIAVIAAPVTYGWLVAPLILAGAGVSMAMPAAQSAVFGAVAPAEIGKAAGTFNMLRYLGGAFGIALLSAAFTANGNFGSPVTFTAGFACSVAVAAALSLLGALAGLCLPGRKAGVAAALAKA